MKKLCKLLLLVSAIQPAFGTEKDTASNINNKEVAGLGLGALVGGLIAGPPGIVIGAAGGAIHGGITGNREHRIATLEQQLHEKQIDLARLQNEFTNIQNQYAINLQKIATQNKTTGLEKFADGISFSIYFRTNEAHIDSSLTPHIRDLVNLIQDTPAIRVLLEAHADERGLPSYNLQLSRSRAKAVQQELVNAGLSSSRIIQNAYGESRTRAKQGDVEGYVFDRRVDIHLTLDKKV